MSHTLKVIIGFTFMIGLGLGFLYFMDQGTFTKSIGGINPINTGAGCAAKGTC